MSFEYKEHLIKVQGGKQYLPVSARLMWVRSEHPDWGIKTTPIEINIKDKYAIFHAEIYDEKGNLIASGTKCEDVQGFKDYLEKAECVPLDTEILTSQGWKLYNELHEGMLILSYNVKTDTSHWVPLQRTVVYKSAPTIRMHNGWGFDVTCTREHTWATKYESTCKEKHYSYLKLVKSCDLKKSHRIITACKAPCGTNSITPYEAAFMGWILTDGGISRQGNSARACIYQSKIMQVEIIRELMKNFEHKEVLNIPNASHVMPQGKIYKYLPAYRWYISANVLKKLFVSFCIENEQQVDSAIPNMTSESRKAMLNAMMLADGDKKGTFGKKRKPWVMRTFALLCALEGIALPRMTMRDVPLQCAKKTRHTYCSNVITEDSGNMDVWCPTTEYGTWYARFSNGCTTITGNTGSVGRALAMAGYGTQFALDELDEGERIVDSPQFSRQSQHVDPKPKTNLSTQSYQRPDQAPVRATSSQSNGGSGLGQKLIILEGFVKYGIPKDAKGHDARGYVYNQVAGKLRNRVVELNGYSDLTEAERNIIEAEMKNPKPKFKALLEKAVTFIPTAEKSSAIAEPASYPIENHVFVDTFEEASPKPKGHGSH